MVEKNAWIAVSAALLLSACGSQTPSAGASEEGAAPAAVQQPPPPPPLMLAEGAPIRVRTTTALSTRSATAGQTFTATLAEPLAVGDRVLAPKGATVTGAVTDSDDGGRIKGVAHISVRLTHLKLANGDEIEIRTGVHRRNAPKTRRQDAVKVGVASGVGAAIGAIAGGGKGAAIGAAAGAGAGTGAVLATHGEPAVIPSESLLTFRLASPVQVAAR